MVFTLKYISESEFLIKHLVSHPCSRTSLFGLLTYPYNGVVYNVFHTFIISKYERTRGLTMKKLTVFITILVLAMFLAACGSESTKTFELDHDGVMTTGMVYTSTGDKVTMQTTENIIQYDLVDITSKEEAQELFAPLIKQFQNIDGLTHKLEYDDSKVTEILAIDYVDVNFEDIEEVNYCDFFLPTHITVP